MKKRALLVLAAAVVVTAAGAVLAPRAAAGNPLARADLVDFTTDAVVLERLPAGGYLYLRVLDGNGEHWVATLSSFAPPREELCVRVQVFAKARDFHSPRLRRDFAELWFAAVQPAVPTKEL